MLDSMRAPLNTMQLKLDNAAVTTTKLTMPAACRSPSDSERRHERAAMLASCHGYSAMMMNSAPT